MIRESAGFGMTAPAQRAVNREARAPAIISSGVTAHYVALLVLEAAMLGVYMSLDLVGFVIWWLVAALAMCFLCGSVAISSERSRRGRRFVDIAVIPSLVPDGGSGDAAHARSQAHRHPDLRPTKFSTSDSIGRRSALAVRDVSGRIRGDARRRVSVVALGCRQQGVLPVSVVLAAVFLKMGTYGFVRLTLPLLPDATRTFAPLLVAVAALGILFGAVAALAQPNWTRVLAYATLSHSASCCLAPSRSHRTV